MYGEGSSDDQPKGSFEIFKAEGDVLFKHGEYRKALESYNTVSICCNSCRYTGCSLIYDKL